MSTEEKNTSKGTNVGISSYYCGGGGGVDDDTILFRLSLHWNVALFYQ